MRRTQRLRGAAAQPAAGARPLRLLAGSACVVAGLVSSTPQQAQEVDALTRDDLQRALAQRDAVIAELLRRVAELEQAHAAAANGASPPMSPIPVAKPGPVNGVTATAAHPPAAPALPGPRLEPSTPPPTTTVAAQPSPASPGPQPAPPAAQAEPEAPGGSEDAVIAELLRHVAEGERARAAAPNGPLPPLSPIPVAKPAPPVPPLAMTVAAAEPPAPAVPPGPQPTSPEAQQHAQVEAEAPGQIEVDEEAAIRALEVTLVQEGALLLPFGQAQFTPSFTYTRSEVDFPIIVTGLLGEREIRRNKFDFFASLLVGLPFDAQLELGLPYTVVDQSAVDRVGGGARQSSSETGHGIGDLSVGLAKTVLREKHWWPDVVARVNWGTGTGKQDDNGILLGGGFQTLAGSVSMAKRQDPLVFVAGGTYQTAFEEDRIEPGDSLGFNVGAFLAASPTTSLSLVLSQSFNDEIEVRGQKIDGSDTVESVLSFGASIVLGRHALLSGAVGAGLTDDSPDYSVSVSLPIRFPVPGM